MAVTEDAIREQLTQVVDPEMMVNIVDLGMIYVINLEIRDDGKTDVLIEMGLTSPMCPYGPQLINQARIVTGQIEGIGIVDVKLVMTPPWTPDRMTEEARDQLGIF